MNFKKYVGFGIILLSGVSAKYSAYAAPELGPGALFVATNHPEHNEVIAFKRNEKGILTELKHAATGGKGLGGQLDPLGSQGSLVLSGDHQWLLAVNAGSNEISVFKNNFGELQLVSKASSFGSMPVSIAIHHHLVFVLNAGNAPSIAGFRLEQGGHLLPLANTSRVLQGAQAGGPAQIGFDRWGKNLVVSDKKSNSIYTYSLSHQGIPSASSGTTTARGLAPFGFSVDRAGKVLIVNAGSGDITTYQLDSNSVSIISESESNGQKAACWIARTQNNFLYTANPGSSSLSLFAENPETGAVSLISAEAAAAKSPLDLGVVKDHYLYALDPVAGGVDVFQISQDGHLSNTEMVKTSIEIFTRDLRRIE